MKFVDNLREKPAVKKIEKFAPAIAFLGGFGWDSITLGRMVESSDLVFLVAYYTGALILVVLLSARLEHPEGWTAERIRAAVKMQAKPAVKPAAKPAPKPAAQVAVAARPAPKPAPVQKKSLFSNKVANQAIALADKAAAEAKEAADRAAAQAKEAAGKASAAAERFAKNMGYESTAIPKNAIVVEHHFLDREWSAEWRQRFSWAVQFCFGSLFSALVVCYFKSSGSLASFILVILLAVLLVGNEFLQKKYESFGVSLAFLSLLGTMFMNFTLPHLVHSIGFIWFFLSTILSLGVCVLIWKISRRSKKVLIAPIAISVCLTVAYLMNWVPPVPLVLKHQLVCQNFDKTDYSCDVDAPNFLQKIGLKSPSVHRLPESEVYVLSSVYAPADLKAELEYRWYYKGPGMESYKLTDKISSGRMVINGGREEGFRSFSKKKNVPAGRYRVETAFKKGAVIGAQTFEVFDEARDSTGYVRKALE
ncbi:DUF2914 domain-containing protein [Fibrobacter sp. UWP2]|uniref:DUF2914 domain-containing protein n=1 Tax=Fibrobacter sp. UWP2 TaxID=1896216 RepID=UPI00091152D8|nr:DUF2914 domain-containing protein [Fibrobacter sp. UWP2]SHJ29096.1 Protein of unknown function [Fibrobacter sp. UWP2]